MNPQKTLESVLDRLVKAGWVSRHARDQRGLGIEWTPAGEDAAKQFRLLFDQLGDEMFADELAVLLTLIDTMSPGGTAEAQRNKLV